MENHPTESKDVPEKLPFLWRLFFFFLIVSGAFSIFLGALQITFASSEIKLASWLLMMCFSAMAISGGYQSLKRKRTGYHYSITILLLSIIYLLGSAWNSEYHVDQALKQLEAIDSQFKMTQDQVKALKEMVVKASWSCAIVFSLLHIWLAIALWKRQHWFNK